MLYILCFIYIFVLPHLPPLFLPLIVRKKNQIEILFIPLGISPANMSINSKPITSQFVEEFLLKLFKANATAVKAVGLWKTYYDNHDEFDEDEIVGSRQKSFMKQRKAVFQNDDILLNSKSTEPAVAKQGGLCPKPVDPYGIGHWKHILCEMSQFVDQLPMHRLISSTGVFYPHWYSWFQLQVVLK